jgi:hypothetical protein
MEKKLFTSVLAGITASLLLFSPLWAAPKGAKAIFDSGEGPGVQVSSQKARKSPGATPVVKQNYVGISYELLLLTDDGQIRKVTKNRTFRGGERLIMRVMTNRSGNLKIYNIGPTGNTNVLFDEPVNAYTMTQVPANSNFQFVGAPGTETLLIMLSDVQAPGDINPQLTAGGDAPQAVPGTNGGTQPAQGGSEPSQVAGFAKTKPVEPSAATPSGPDASLPPSDSGDQSLPPSATAIASNIEGAKKIKGSKDIVVEDGMQSSFSVISPDRKWKPVKSGTKDIVIESSDGTNYGVVPVSAVGSSGILSLTVKLKHG